MNKTLMRIVVDCACFFELVDERLLDSRVALKQLEQLKWELRKLAAEERTQLASYITELAAEAEGKTGRDRRWQCLIDLPQALGLTDWSEGVGQG